MSVNEQPEHVNDTASAEAHLRPMGEQDAVAADEVMQTALADTARRRGQEQHSHDPSRATQMEAVLKHFMATDPAGCWVAERDGEMLGMAVAIRRGELWGLGLLFIMPSAQRMGLGRALLDRCASYAEGASIRMIMTSTDPRSMRTYAAHGLDVHPAMIATGIPQIQPARAEAAGRRGSLDDISLVEEVDLAVRGSSRAVDVEFLLGEGATLVVLEDDSGRGYAMHAPGLPVVGGHPMMLSATSEITAGRLLWQVLGCAGEPVEIFGLTGRQSWAIRIALEAGLTVSPGSPMCLTPGLDPPGPWLLSGIYF